MRRTIWILLCLLLAVGAWLFLRQSNRPAEKNSAPETKQIAAHKKVIAPGVVRTISASTAPNVLPAALTSTNSLQASAAKTNRFAYRLTNTKKTIGELTDDPHAILLENALIDTGTPLNFSIPRSLQAVGDPGAYIVQANGPINNSFRAMLAQAGAQIVSYIPNDAYLVIISAGGPNEIIGQPGVQSVIPYEPYYKVSPSLMQWIGKELPADSALNVELFPGKETDTLAQIQKLGGTVLYQDGDGARIQAPANWTAVAQLTGVHVVEPFHPRVAANDLARVTLGISTNTTTPTNYMGLSGKNVLVEVNDTGIDATHPDFSATGTAASGPSGASRVIGDAAQSLMDTDGHGTHVAGILAGNGSESLGLTGPLGPGPNIGAVARGSVTNADFRGKAPLATLFSVAFLGAPTNNETGDRYLQETPANTNALISNNSWGRIGDDDYDLSAASFDAAVRDALPQVMGSQPVLFVFAGGNGGNGDDDGGSGDPDTISSPSTAKNVITVGAMEQLRNITNIVTDLNSNKSAVWLPQTDSSVQVAGYSSRGNVGVGMEGSFGRFKPDVVAPGSFVVSTRSSQWLTNVYYNPTNDNVTELFTIVEPNSLSDPNDVSFFVFKNAVQVKIDAFDISSSSPVDLPIYVWPGTDPNTTPPVLEGTNSVIVPAVPSETQWSCSVGNTSTNEIIVELIVDVQTTNDLGNYESVLQALNETLAPYYRYESGTSMAAPAVSGLLALMQDYFTNTLHLTPSPALLKAMLINGARAINTYKFAVTNQINFQGWGLPNLTNSLPPGVTNQLNTTCSTFFLDQNPTNALATGDSHTFMVTITNAAALSQPLRATLVWTDPAGDPIAAIKLVNNLDLVITNLATTNVYYGNNFSLSGNPPFSLAANSNSLPDSINNVENVFLATPPTNFSVTVVGREVNVNAVTAQTNNSANAYAPNVVQDFALVISSGNGAVTNAMVVTDAGISSNPTTDQLITDVGTTNTPLFNQLVGANTPLLGTNTISITANSQLNGLQLSGSNSNVVATVGMTNQWHFYVVTNTGTASDFTNAAFITFFPSTLSIPRMGVFEQANPDNATRPEADIDMYVSTNPALTNFDLPTLAAADKSLSRGGTEFVFYTNSVPGDVYYIGVKSEDQNASEFGFIPIFTQTPFSELDSNGNQVVNGLLLPVNIPDGSPAHPGIGYVFALATMPMEVNNVSVYTTIAHQNFGDLVGVMNHNDITDVLNNHDSLFNPSGVYTNIYDDSGQGQIPGSQPSDGPGSLRNFTGTEAVGPWILTEVDDSLTQTGAVTGLTLVIQPHRDLKQPGITLTLQPGEFFIDYIDVPVGVTNLTVSAIDETPIATPGSFLQLFVKEGSPPNLSDTNDMVLLTNVVALGLSNSISIGPPLTPDRYFVGVFNPDTVTHTVFLSATLSFSAAAAETIDFHPGGQTTILDDAVTYSSIFVPNADIIQDVNVGLRVDHPRISDLVFHLISPDGTRYLLMENRGGTTTNGAGISIVTTNIVPVNSSGGPEAETNTIDTGLTSGTITVTYDFFSVPDEMVVQYEGATIFDSGLVSGTGTANISYGPGSSTSVSIIMNPGGNAETNTAWTYTVTSTQAKYDYLTFTEDTNLTTTPIKYAVPPFVLMFADTNAAFTNSFEGLTATDYFAGQSFSNGWTVISNQVSIVTDPTNAFEGSNFLALANGVISNTLPTIAGDTYTLSFAYRGPGIVSFWRGETNALDSIGGNNGSLQNGAGFTAGEVGEAFNLDGANDYVLVNPSSNLDVGSQGGFTIEGWIHPTTVASLHTIAEYERILGSSSGADVGVQFYVSANGSATLFANVKDIGGGDHTLTTANGLMTVGTWQHVTLSYNKASGVATIYRNGIVVQQASLGSFNPETTFTNFLLGARTFTGSAGSPVDQFSGSLDEMSVYSRALSGSEIHGIWTNGTAGKFDLAPQNLAEASVNLSSANAIILSGDNNNWQTYTTTFTATNNGTPLVLAGIEPGMLLDDFTLSSAPKNLDYLPEQSTQPLIGQSAFGTWQLEIQDDRAGAGLTNTLLSWQLEFVFANTNFTLPPGFINASTNLVMDELTTDTVANPATNNSAGTVTYTLLNSPAFATIDPATGLITLTPQEADGPGDYTITTVATDSGPPPSSATNSFIVSVNEVNSAPFWPTNVPSQTNYFINALGTLTVMNTATDTDIPVNPLTYALLAPPTPANVAIDTNTGVITFTPTLAQASNTYTFTTIVTDTNVFALTNKSLRATNSFTVTVTAFPILTDGIPQTNSVDAGSIVYYAVNVPTNADFATNILLFADAPVNLLFNQNGLPIGTNPGDFTLLLNSTNGIGVPILGLGTTPPLIPGSTYYLGVQNTNTFTVNFAVEVDFHLVTNSTPASTNISITSITYTNINGTNGFFLIWFAPSNDLFQVQYKDDLAAASWNTFTNIISYDASVFTNPTNTQFDFFDDGSETGGLPPMRFYRLLLLQSTNALALPFQNNLTASAGIPLTITNTATELNANAILNYVLTTSPSTTAIIDTNGIITWTPGGGNAGNEFKFITVVTDNGTPAANASNSFTVFVLPSPAIGSAVVTSTNATLQWSAPTNDIFQVEWTASLTPVILWTPFPATITSITGLFTFVDTNAPLAMKFYRLTWLPLP